MAMQQGVAMPLLLQAESAKPSPTHPADAWACIGLTPTSTPCCSDDDFADLSHDDLFFEHDLQALASPELEQVVEAYQELSAMAYGVNVGAVRAAHAVVYADAVAEPASTSSLPKLVTKPLPRLVTKPAPRPAQKQKRDSVTCSLAEATRELALAMLEDSDSETDERMQRDMLQRIAAKPETWLSTGDFPATPIRKGKRTAKAAASRLASMAKIVRDATAY